MIDVMDKIEHLCARHGVDFAPFKDGWGETFTDEQHAAMVEIFRRMLLEVIQPKGKPH